MELSFAVPSDLTPWLEIWPQRLQVWSQSDAMINWTVFISPGIQIVGTSNRAEGHAMLGILLRGIFVHKDQARAGIPARPPYPIVIGRNDRTGQTLLWSH